MAKDAVEPVAVLSALWRIWGGWLLRRGVQVGWNVAATSEDWEAGRMCRGLVGTLPAARRAEQPQATFALSPPQHTITDTHWLRKVQKAQL